MCIRDRVRIPANDLKRPFELHAAEYEKKALEVLRSGWYILGREVASFEEAFAAYLGVKCCVGLASGCLLYTSPQSRSLTENRRAAFSAVT